MIYTVVCAGVSKDYGFHNDYIEKPQVKLNETRPTLVSASYNPVTECRTWSLLSHFNYKLL